MPIPLLFIGVGAAAGALGIGKTVKAGVDQKDAKDTNVKAEKIVKSATELIEKNRKNVGNSISELGQRKIKILDEGIKPFIEEFEKIHHIDLLESDGLRELNGLTLDKKSFQELKDIQTMASSIATGIATGTIAGAVTAFGAYSVAGTFATASTGTAIASLSGAAATNATLAFFGGGSIAVNGLGVAGGSMVLGGLVAGPALAVMSWVLGAKASANRDNAYGNLAKANEYCEEMKLAASACIAIRRRLNLFNRFLISLGTVFEPLVFEMTQIIANKGTDYRKFSDEEKKVLAESLAIAGAIKTILDTSILDENGNLCPESENIISLTRGKLGM